MIITRSEEFPNDNPALWLVELPEPLVELEPVADVAPLETTVAPSEATIAPPEATVVPPETTIVPPPPDAFGELVQILIDVAVAHGAVEAAMALPELLASEEHGAKARAWRDFLVGDGDMAACGDAMLNEWAASVLAAAMGAPGRAHALQYDLRRRGVAAFGLLRAA